MKQKLFFWIEKYLFFPNYLQRIVSFLLLPITCLYILIILLKRAFSKAIDYNIPIISVGNIVVGGSGKTPITIELAKRYKNVCIILRGYKRESKGLVIVSLNGKILVDVKTSGDEAMLLAKALNNASIIVSENRVTAILKAKELDCKVIFLDDGFSKYSIKKFDILLKSKKEPTNNFCLPSGAYREPKSFYNKANLILQEEKDFKRIVNILIDNSIVQIPQNALLLTAISKPTRLLEFLPKDIKTVFFEDHHIFTQEEINKIKDDYKDVAIIITHKDYVKLQEFNIENLYIMDLSIKINNQALSTIDSYINNY